MPNKLSKCSEASKRKGRRKDSKRMLDFWFWWLRGRKLVLHSCFPRGKSNEKEIDSHLEHGEFEMPGSIHMEKWRVHGLDQSGVEKSLGLVLDKVQIIISSTH